METHEWILKCRECKAEFPEDSALEMNANPSGIMQEVCTCGGALDLQMKEDNG